MRINSLFEKTFVVLILLLLCSCSKDSSKDKKTVSSSKKFVIENTEGFYGWDSFTINNVYARLDVVPEVGGRILGYECLGYQVLWHNTSHEGEVEIFQQNDLGQSFTDAGGAKIWPAPQDKWGGPPDKILDGLPYTYSLNENTITVTSPKDTGNNRTGLQFMHSYLLRPISSIAELKISMSNVVDHNIEWALWHLATVPANRKFTVYAPVDKGNWDVMLGENDGKQWLGVENGLFRARYNKDNGKVGMMVREGWVAMHDEENEILFAMFFPLKKGAKYPHGGHNVEIFSSGAVKDFDGAPAPDMEFMELEILGPLTELSPGESTSLDVKWAVCRCTSVKKVLPFGVISKEFEFNDKDETLRENRGIVTGKFSVFHVGTLEEFFVDKNGNQKGLSKLMDVSPLSEISINREIVLPKEAVAVRYQIIGRDKNLIGIIEELKID